MADTGKTIEKRKPGRPKGSTAAVVSERDRELFRGFARGLMVSTLAQTYGIDERNVRDIIKAQRGQVLDTLTREPGEVLEDYLLNIDAAIDELVAVASASKGSVRVSAISARLMALKEKREVLQKTGVLPEQLHRLSEERDLTDLARKIGGVLARAEVSDEAITEIVDLLAPEREVIEATAEEIE